MTEYEADGEKPEDAGILYFQMQEGISAKRHRWSQINLPVFTIDMGKDGRLGCCLVPEYYMTGRKWEEGFLIEKLNGMLQGGNWQGYFVQPSLCRLAGLSEGLPPEILFEKLLEQIPCWEYLIYIGEEGNGRPGSGEEECFRLLHLLRRYLPRINRFTAVTDVPASYELFAGMIYEEYGIPTFYTRRLEQRSGKDGRTVVLDARGRWCVPYRAIPEETFYVDYWSVGEKKELLAKMRRDIRYLGAVNFLDTLVKNGYNTIVN